MLPPSFLTANQRPGFKQQFENQRSSELKCRNESYRIHLNIPDFESSYRNELNHLKLHR